jgi:hypothetical protein
MVWTNIHFAHTDNVFEPSKNSTNLSRGAIQVLLRSHSENKLGFVTCYMIHKRTSCSYDFPLHWKATMTTTTDEIFGRKQMQMLV